MSELVDASQIEAIVGARRHPTEHLGRAVPEEQQVYILHSQKCLDSGRDLRECPYSLALDRGIDQKPVASMWGRRWGRTVKLKIVVGGLLSPFVMNEITAPRYGVDLIEGGHR